MRTRGKKPSINAWRVTENAPEISAWEAMMVANVDMITKSASAMPP